MVWSGSKPTIANSPACEPTNWLYSVFTCSSVTDRIRSMDSSIVGE